MVETDSEDEEKVVSSRLIARGKLVNVRRVVVRLPSGTRSSRLILEHSGSVAVVPLLDDGRMVLIRQFRLAAGGTIWEIPAGHIERGEAPEHCARRELEEETGYRAGKIEPLFEAYLSPGSSTELMRFFLATGLELGPRRPEADEIIAVRPMETLEVDRMLSANEIRDAKTIAALAYLQSRGRLHAGRSSGKA